MKSTDVKGYVILCRSKDDARDTTWDESVFFEEEIFSTVSKAREAIKQTGVLLNDQFEYRICPRKDCIFVGPKQLLQYAKKETKHS